MKGILPDEQDAEEIAVPYGCGTTKDIIALTCEKVKRRQKIWAKILRFTRSITLSRS